MFVCIRVYLSQLNTYSQRYKSSVCPIFIRLFISGGCFVRELSRKPWVSVFLEYLISWNSGKRKKDTLIHTRTYTKFIMSYSFLRSTFPWFTESLEYSYPRCWPHQVSKHQEFLDRHYLNVWPSNLLYFTNEENPK